MIFRTAVQWAAVVVGVGVGCTPRLSVPDLGRLYDRAASASDSQRNPVIVIPGILGSHLRQVRTDRVVWGAFSPGFADPRDPEGARLVALPMREGVPLAALTDDVEPAGVLDRIELPVFGLPVRLSAYARILGVLGAGGYRDQSFGESGAINYGTDHYTCFQFDYDWRRDNVENARRLARFIRVTRAFVQERIRRREGVPDADVRFDIVAHSMGGLVARYFLQYGDADLPADGSLPPLTWAGSRHIDKVILVGTPNAGSARAITELVEGADFAPGLVPAYDAALLGTFPSIYQLLPRDRHGALVDARTGGRITGILDAALWERMGWGLASPRADRVLERLLPGTPDPAARRRIARDHLAKCLTRARHFTAALDRPAPLPRGLQLCLFAGDAEPTDAVIAADPADGSVRVAERGPGDDTVLRTSTLLDERVGRPWTPRLVSPIEWSAVTFLFTDHLGLTTSPAFADNVLFLLLEAPRPPRPPAPPAPFSAPAGRTGLNSRRSSLYAAPARAHPIRRHRGDGPWLDRPTSPTASAPRPKPSATPTPCSSARGPAWAWTRACPTSAGPKASGRPIRRSAAGSSPRCPTPSGSAATPPWPGGSSATG